MISTQENLTTESTVSGAKSQEWTESKPAKVEKWALLIGGSAMALYGLQRRSTGGLALAALGGGLVYGGVKTRTAFGKAVSVRHKEGIKVVGATTINRSPDEVYRFWRNLENLSRFSKHVESVERINSTCSHWTVRAPAGTTVEWDAEIINEKENEMIAWRSLEGADVGNAGSVHFEPAPAGRGTRVRVVLEYDPPGGTVSAFIAKVLGKEPQQQVKEGLQKIKQILEAGDILTTEGQPTCRNNRKEGGKGQ